MTAPRDWLARIESAYGAAADVGFGPPTVRVPPQRWAEAVRIARDDLGCDFFDYLTAVDEAPAAPVDPGPPAGAADDGPVFTVLAHLAALSPAGMTSLLLATGLGPDTPSVACVCSVYAGAAWHERETHEMFGIGFDGHGPLEPLLLPDTFVGHPLRKDFVLASRVAKPWPGAKEPGESESDAAPSRRRTRPPGVPDPGTWGPGPGGSR